MARQYLENNHVTYYVITQVGVYAAQQWYVLRPTWRVTAGHNPGLEFDGGTAAICRHALPTGRNASWMKQ